MAQPNAEEITQVKEAVKQCVTEDEFKDFDEVDFELLWRGKHRSAAALKKASREQLTSIKLPGALVDYLKPSQGSSQFLDDRQVLALLQQLYGRAFQQRLQKEVDRPNLREGPIRPASDSVLPDLGSRLRLQGYDKLALRTIKGLVALQDLSDQVTDVGVAEEHQERKFKMGVQVLRLVGAPGTGKSTALQELFKYTCQHFDRLIELLPPPPAAVAVLRQRVKSCFSRERFLSFTFSNAGLSQLLTAERTAASFMATRMLHAMVGGLDKVTCNYEQFVTAMPASLRMTLLPSHLMDFIQVQTGMGSEPGMVGWNFDECGAANPSPEGDATYFQNGMASLVAWRRAEAQRRFGIGGTERNMLPVVVIAGSHAHKMTLLKTSRSRAQPFDLDMALLDDVALQRAADDMVKRIADGSRRPAAHEVDAAGFRRECLIVATRSEKWAWLGPGNDGPGGFIVLHSSSEPGKRVVLSTQSKLRRAAISRYAQTAVGKEAAKYWEVGPGYSVLLYLTDEQGRGFDLLHLDTAGGAGVVPVSGDARIAARRLHRSS